MEFVPATEREGFATGEAWCLAFVEGRLLLPEPEAALLQPMPVPGFEPWPGTRHYLGRLGGLDCLTFETPEVPEGWRPVPLRAAMMQFPPPLAELASRAAQVLEWDRAHRFCGGCGTPTEPVPRERARRCPSCGRVAYPRVSPSMMVLIHRPGELLLARGPHFVSGMYSALAGFVEAGESIEQCVHREAFEEVGVRVGALRYFGSQSWPFPHSLMIAFTAEWTGGTIVPQDGEIEDAQWFPVDALPKVPPRFSIAGHLIRDTVAAMR